MFGSLFPAHAARIRVKRGQGVMRLFIDLSLKFAPHEIISRVIIW
jgi:hypothetical protein